MGNILSLIEFDPGYGHIGGKRLFGGDDGQTSQFSRVESGTQVFRLERGKGDVHACPVRTRIESRRIVLPGKARVVRAEVDVVLVAVPLDQEADALEGAHFERAALFGQRQGCLDETALVFERYPPAEAEAAFTVERLERGLAVRDTAHHPVGEGLPGRAERGNSIPGKIVDEENCRGGNGH